MSFEPIGLANEVGRAGAFETCVLDELDREILLVHGCERDRLASRFARP